MLTAAVLLKAIRLQVTALIPFEAIPHGLIRTLIDMPSGRPRLTPRALLRSFPLPPSREAESWSLPCTTPLTERELAIGCALARGESYNQIAGKLHLTRSTVRYHVAQLFNKLCLADRYALAEHFNRPIAFPPHSGQERTADSSQGITSPDRI